MVQPEEKVLLLVTQSRGKIPWATGSCEHDMQTYVYRAIFIACLFYWLKPQKMLCEKEQVVYTDLILARSEVNFGFSVCLHLKHRNIKNE